MILITSPSVPWFLKAIANNLRALSLSFWILGFIGVVTLPAQASSDLSGKAARCGNFQDCFDIMLQSTNPRNAEAINIAAARIAGFPKSARGNRNVARELNANGLTEFKNGNFAEAARLFLAATSEDPGDVEVLSNLGLALLRANRAQEAVQVLRNSLIINPRRTSAWVPMADALYVVGENDSAIAALLLGYEFSENRENTRSFFNSKAGSSDRSASLYAQALRRMDEQHQKVATSTFSASSLSDRQTLSKSEARAYIVRELDADLDLRSDPMKKEMIVCFFDGALDDIYSDVSSLDKATFESRLSKHVDGMNKDDPKVQLRVMKCFVNSPMLEQAMKEKNAEKRSPSSGSSATLLDMNDLRLDMASLDGKNVRVRGVGHYFMDIFMLKKDYMDMNPIIVDISKLPRDQRRKILTECSDLMSGCSVTVSGTVGEVSFQKGLLAELVEW